MQPSPHKVRLHGGLPQRAQGFQSVHEDESAQNQALGASGQPILALRAQNGVDSGRGQDRITRP